MRSQISRQTLKKKAPQIIALTIAIIICGYLMLEFLADMFIKGESVSFTHTVASWGYPGLFGLMILEASSLPIPSEVILPFAGYLISVGHLDFLATIVIATVATLTGSLIDYYIGLKGVQVLTRYRLLGRTVFSEDQLRVAACYFSKYGAIMVLVGRLIPMVRTLISFPAGAVRMSLVKFVSYTLAGCLVWNSLLIYVGFYLGSKWQEVADASHYLVVVVAAGGIALFAALIVWRKRRKTKQMRFSLKPLL
ncbi:DedA family protein [Candidatus Bathyarchaeota archaeon]|nr:DedA family protein [Candidatus Bathyarchaeota archaeon]